jgi:hypothetical protein
VLYYYRLEAAINLNGFGKKYHKGLKKKEEALEQFRKHQELSRN